MVGLLDLLGLVGLLGSLGLVGLPDLLSLVGLLVSLGWLGSSAYSTWSDVFWCSTFFKSPDGYEWRAHVVMFSQIQ